MHNKQIAFSFVTSVYWSFEDLFDVNELLLSTLQARKPLLSPLSSANSLSREGKEI